MRLIAGDLTPQAGSVSSSGGLGVMRQFIGGSGTPPRSGLPAVAGLARVRDAAAALDAAS